MFKGVMQMALPTSQPLNWLQRLAAWLFRIDTRQQIIHKAPVYIKGGSPVEFSVVTHAKRNGEWRPVVSTPVEPVRWPPKPTPLGVAPIHGINKTAPKQRKAFTKFLGPQALYNEVAKAYNWEQIISRPNWYRVYKITNKSSKHRKLWQLELHGGSPIQKIKQRSFNTQEQANKFAMQLINIHLSKQS
jgi:hypothetical protein